MIKTVLVVFITVLVLNTEEYFLLLLLGTTITVNLVTLGYMLPVGITLMIRYGMDEAVQQTITVAPTPINHGSFVN